MKFEYKRILIAISHHTQDIGTLALCVSCFGVGSHHRCPLYIWQRWFSETAGFVASLLSKSGLCNSPLKQEFKFYSCGLSSSILLINQGNEAVYKFNSMASLSHAPNICCACTPLSGWISKLIARNDCGYVIHLQVMWSNSQLVPSGRRGKERDTRFAAFHWCCAQISPLQTHAPQKASGRSLH